MSSQSNERPWLPESPPIKRDCDGCGRGIPEYLFTEGYSYDTHIYNIYHDEVDRKWTHCGDCKEDIIVFAQDVLDLHGEDYRENRPDCGFCGDGLGDLRWSFAFSPTWVENFQSTVLCENCQNVISNYVDSVPETPPDGPDPHNDAYYPQELSENPVRKHSSNRDKGAILDIFRGLGEDDSVYFEAHRKGVDGEPDQYLCGTGSINEVRESGLTGRELRLERTGKVEGFWLRQVEPTKFKLKQVILMDSNDYVSVDVQDNEETGRNRPYRFTGHVTVLDPQ